MTLPAESRRALVPASVCRALLDPLAVVTAASSAATAAAVGLTDTGSPAGTLAFWGSVVCTLASGSAAFARGMPLGFRLALLEATLLGYFLLSTLRLGVGPNGSLIALVLVVMLSVFRGLRAGRWGGGLVIALYGASAWAWIQGVLPLDAQLGKEAEALLDFHQPLVWARVLPLQVVLIVTVLVLLQYVTHQWRNSEDDASETTRLLAQEQTLRAEAELQRRQQAELRMASDLKFRALFETANDAILLIDGREGIVSCNPRTASLFGCEAASLIGRFPSDLSPPQQPDGGATGRKGRELLDAALSGLPQRFDWRYRRCDGTEFDADVNLTRFEEGGKMLLQAVIRDVTELRRATKALQASEARFRSLVDGLKDVVYSLASDGTITFVGPQVRHYGFTPQELIGRKLEPLVFPEDRVAVLRTFEEALATGAEMGNTFRLYSKAGDVIWFEDTSRVVHDEQGRAAGVSGILRDVSERKRAEEERARLQLQLNHAQKMESVGRLAGGVAHDFNNMLTAIQGNASIALEKVPPGEALRENLEEILHCARRSADLTRQLLAFARKQTIAPRVLDLNAAVEASLNMLRRLIGENIRLTWQPGAGLWPVKMDPTQVNQVLTSLCVNARDAIAGVGTVTIETGNVSRDAADATDHSTLAPAQYIRLAIRDDGCGMDEEVQRHLFEPFFTTKDQGHGSGLGLATVYGIVTQNGGSLQVRSAPGRGSTFELLLPRAEGDLSSDRGNAVRPPAQLPPKTILLVEDEPTILAIARSVLERLGYTVLSAATPTQALQRVRQSNAEIHLLLTDVIMPEMNGRDLAERVRALRPALKCIFMSGYSGDVMARNGVLEGGVHFVAKPFSIQDLAEKVRLVLEEKTGE